MTWGIVASVGSTLVGGLLQGGADSDAAATRQAAIDSFTGQQKGIFDQRTADQQAAKKREDAIKAEGFDVTNAKKTTNLDELLGIQNKYDTAGTNANVAGSAALTGIDNRKSVLDSASSLEAGDFADQERARQAGFQGDATTVANNVVKNLGIGSFADGQQRSLGQRGFLTDQSIGSIPRLGNIAGGDTAVNSELAKQIAQRVGTAATGTQRADAASAYGDAAGIGDRLVGRAGQQISLLGRKAQTSEEALNPELSAATMVRTNADADATTRKQNATSDLNSYIKILQDAQNKETSRVTQRQSATDDLLNKFYSGQITTEEDFANALMNSSLGYEDALKQLMNFKVGGTVGSSPVGQLLSSAGSAGISAGISKLFK